MALFKIFKGSKDNLGKTGNITQYVREGFAYFTPDDGKFYIDIAGSNEPGQNEIIAEIGINRIPLNAAQADFVKNNFILRISNGNTENNNLYTFNGSETKQLNFQADNGISFISAQNSLTIGINASEINTGILRTGFGGTGNDTYVANRLIYSETENKLNSTSNISTDGNSIHFLKDDGNYVLISNKYNDVSYTLLRDHHNGNISLSASSGSLHLGYSNTSGLYLYAGKDSNNYFKRSIFAVVGNNDTSTTPTNQVIVYGSGGSLSQPVYVDTYGKVQSITATIGSKDTLIWINEGTITAGLPVWTLTNPTQFIENESFNDKTIIGNYYISANAIAATIPDDGKPGTGSIYGTLKVSKIFTGTTNANYLRQDWFAHSSAKHLTRRTNSSAEWSGWSAYAYIPPDTTTQKPIAVGSVSQPVYVKSTGEITAITGAIANDITGNANTATAFASNATISLTGNITGFADGTHGWSINTTIGASTVTNAMLAGSITNDKLDKSTIEIVGTSVALGSGIDKITLLTNLGLTNAAHYIGKAKEELTDGGTENPNISGYDFANDRKSGDIVLGKDGDKEYIWGLNGWELLGPVDTIQTSTAAGTINRMAYYSAANMISSGDSIYADASHLTINGTAIPANSGNFQVIGISTMRDIIPEQDSKYHLGNTASHWVAGYTDIFYISSDINFKYVAKNGDIAAHYEGDGIYLNKNDLRIYQADNTISARLYLNTLGTVDTAGVSMLTLGNNIVTENINNSSGILRLYSPDQGYMSIKASTVVRNHLHYLPIYSTTTSTSSSVYYGRLVGIYKSTTVGDNDFEDVGSTSQPVYVTANGVIKAVSLKPTLNNLLSSLTEGTADALVDAGYIISTNNNGATNDWYLRSNVTIWNYIKNHITNDLYWANIKVQDSSKTDTIPTFKTIYFGSVDPTTNGRGILTFSSTYPNHGLWYFNDSTDVITLDGHGKANSKTEADLAINALGEGIISTRNRYIPHTGNTTGTVGTMTRPVYVNAGIITQGSYELKATVDNGTQHYLTMYTTADGKTIGPASSRTSTVLLSSTVADTLKLTSTANTNYLTYVSSKGTWKTGMGANTDEYWIYSNSLSNWRIAINNSNFHLRSSSYQKNTTPSSNAVGAGIYTRDIDDNYIWVLRGYKNTSNTMGVQLFTYGHSTDDTSTSMFAIYRTSAPDTYINWTSGKIGNSIYPWANASYNIGSNDLAWNQLHLTYDSSSARNKGIRFMNTGTLVGNIGATAQGLGIYGNGHLYLRPSLTETQGMEITSTAVHPATNHNIDLGTTSLRWNQVHAKSYYIEDTRNENLTAATNDKAIRFFFSNNNMPNNQYWSGIHVRGWTGGYSSWELVGPADNVDQSTTPLYIKTSNINTGWGEWRPILDSYNGVMRFHYGGTGTTTKILITINNTSSWMVSFTLRLYQGYQATDLQISGYNYNNADSPWSSPQAIVLGSTAYDGPLVYFGYTDTQKLWVAVDGARYTGVDVFGVTNGYTQINLKDFCTITNVSTLPGTLQKTVRAYSRLAHNVVSDTGDITLHNQPGTFAFSGNGDPWSGNDWVGFQVGNNLDKFQIVRVNSNNLLFRQNDSGGVNTSWGVWEKILTDVNTSWTAWTAGTTAGPQANLSLSGTTITSAAIPSASTSASGIVTTAAQTFAGTKTFTNPETINSTGNGAAINFKFSNAASANAIYGSNWITYANNGGRFYWREWGGTADGRTTGYEQYCLPACNAGRTTTATYDIFTSKNQAAPSKGTATRIAYYSAAGTIDDASNVQYIPTQNAELGTTKGSVNGLFIYGPAYGNDTANLGSATINVFRYGDPGPQIRFSTGLGTANAGAAESSAIIWSDHSSSIGTDQSFHFVGQNNTSHAASNVGVVTNTFIGKTRISAGVNYANTNYVLFSNGTTGINGQLYLQGASTRDTAPSSNDNRVLYFTDSARNDQGHIYFRHNTAGQHLMYLNTYSSGTKGTRDHIVLISDTDTTDPHYIQINSRISTSLNISSTRGFAYDKTDTPGVHISNAGRIYITANSNTVTIGSQNAGYTHIYNSANIPFIFNKSILTVTGNLGSTSYPWNNIVLGNSAGTANADIILHSSKADNTLIRFLVNTSNGNGQGIRIGGGGLTVIGGGESAATVQSGTGYASDAEQMLIANDNEIRFYPNQGSAYTASALIQMTAGRIWAGVNGDTTRENQVGVQSGAGQLYMYSAAATDGNKGIYFPAANGNSSGYIARVDNLHRVIYNENFVSQKVTLIANTGANIASGQWLRTCIISSLFNYANFQIKLTGGWSTGSPTIATIDVNMRNGQASMKLVHRGFLGIIGKVKLVKLATNTAYLDVYIREASKDTVYIAQFTGDVLVSQNADTTNGSTNKVVSDVAGLATLDLTAGVGNASTPVYIGADGKPAACTAYSSATVNIANNLKTTQATNATKMFILGQSAAGAGQTTYIATAYSSGSANTTGIYFQGSTGVLMGAAWNDYAEFRQSKENKIIEPGRVVYENGDDTLSVSNERLMRGCSIVSDTYGFGIGESEEAQLPIAVSGRVLAYPYENKEEFKTHIGWPVCSGPKGTVSIMTEEEEEKYPSRIIGTISAVPDYEIWHGGADVEVNGRVWIKVR